MSKQSWSNLESRESKDTQIETINQVALAFETTPEHIMFLSGLSKTANTVDEELSAFLGFQIAQVDPADRDRYRTVVMRTAEAARAGFAPA